MVMILGHVCGLEETNFKLWAPTAVQVKLKLHSATVTPIQKLLK